jgi:alkylated DNA repair dioxygenase AlkB
VSYQPSLFSPSPQRIQLPDAEVVYWPTWLVSQVLSCPYFELYSVLKRDVDWQQSTIFLYGKSVTIPRLNAWYGDPNCGYTYSGRYFEPLTWLPQLLEIKQLVESVLVEHLEGKTFNSALLNCYRDGQDSVAWHSDDEAELGTNPLVASVSLGASRVFQLRHSRRHASKHEITLADGDLLLMAGPMQHHWQHQIPKTLVDSGERISITFRRVY